MADLRTDEIRGEDAKRILESPLYREAVAQVRERIIEQLELAEVSGERRERLNNLLIAHNKVTKYLQNVIATGTMAAIEIDQQATLAQRIGERVRRVI